MNKEHMYGASVQDCMVWCCARSWCNSFDYKKASFECDLSDAEKTTELTSNAPYLYDYYSRDAQEGWAEVGSACEGNSASAPAADDDTYNAADIEIITINTQVVWKYGLLIENAMRYKKASAKTPLSNQESARGH